MVIDADQGAGQEGWRLAAHHRGARPDRVLLGRARRGHDRRHGDGHQGGNDGRVGARQGAAGPSG